MNLEQLACRIRLGDKEALKELIRAYGSDLYQKAYARTKDPALAKEATRKTFAQFVSALQNSPEADGWRLWLETLSGKNIDDFSRVSDQVLAIGQELDRELFSRAATALPGASVPHKDAAYPVQSALPQPENAPRRTHASAAVPREPLRREKCLEPVRQQPSRPITERRAGQKRTRSDRVFADDLSGVSQKRRPLLALFLVVVCVALLWTVLGVSMSFDLLPKIDLGYRWFNANVVAFF